MFSIFACVCIFIPQSKCFKTCFIYSDMLNQKEALTFCSDIREGSRGTDGLLDVPVTQLNVQDARGSQTNFDSFCQVTCFIYCNKNKCIRELQWEVLRLMCPNIFFSNRTPFWPQITQASCLFWPLYKWFLAVRPSFLVPDLRQSLDAGLPDIHSYIYSHTCSCYHCKPALEQAEAKSDNATSTPPPAPHSCSLPCA